MSEPQSDALVFFGATGDLAYKKIFPSLQAMVKRGHLDVPVIGVAKAGWNLDQLQGAGARQPGEAWRPRSSSVRQAVAALALRRRRLRRSGDVPGHSQGARRGAAAGALSRHPAGLVRDGRRAARESRIAPTARASSSRSRSGTISRRRAQLNEILLEHVRRRSHLPHRPLPWQAAGAQHGLLPLRQLVPGAVLEPQLRREACRSPWRRISACRVAARSTTRPAPSAT